MKQKWIYRIFLIEQSILYGNNVQEIVNLNMLAKMFNIKNK